MLGRKVMTGGMQYCKGEKTGPYDPSHDHQTGFDCEKHGMNMIRFAKKKNAKNFQHWCCDERFDRWWIVMQVCANVMSLLLWRCDASELCICFAVTKRLVGVGVDDDACV